MANQFEVGQIYFKPKFGCIKIICQVTSPANIPLADFTVVDCDISGKTIGKPRHLFKADAAQYIAITAENCAKYTKQLDIMEKLQSVCCALWDLERTHRVGGIVKIIKQLQVIKP